MAIRALSQSLLLLLPLCLAGCPGPTTKKVKIRVQGSTTVNPVMAKVAERLRNEKGYKITVDTQGGSSGGINAAGEGTADIGMSSKPVAKKDFERYKERKLTEHIIGYDAIALVVSAPVFNGGIKALDREQIAGIFSGKVQNWKELGGPDLPVFVYNKEPGRGTLAMFEKFVFGGPLKNRPAMRNYAEVGGNEETRAKIASHGSAVGQLSVAWAEGRADLKIVAIKTDKGAITPTIEHIKARDYPIVRDLRLITAGETKGPIREVLDYVFSDKGQAIVKEEGYLPAKSLP